MNLFFSYGSYSINKASPTIEKIIILLSTDFAQTYVEFCQTMNYRELQIKFLIRNSAQKI